MQLQAHDRIDDDTARAVRTLAEQTTLVDGVAPLSEQTLLGLLPRVGGDEADEQRELTHVVAREANDVVGYAQIERGDSTSSAELVVAPTARRRGTGSALLERVLDTAPDARVWSHGYLTAAQALAEQTGLVVVRELWQMARPARPGAAPQDVALPEGFTMRTWRPDDVQRWLEVNAAAFAHHPEQGAMTAADVRAREAEPWFDAGGFFLIFDEREGREPQLAAFHWTKVEPPEGEVYVVGVRPDLQGLGLGRAATRVGLAHLDRLAERVTLYVDGDNDAAVATYTGEGFEQVALDVQLARPS